MWTSDTLIGHGSLFERATSTIDSAIAINHHIANFIGINQLYGLRMGAKRFVIGLDGDIIFEFGTAVKCSATLQMKMHIAFQYDRANLIAAHRNNHTTTSSLRASVDCSLNGFSAEFCGIAYSSIFQDIIICSIW